ncbi:predicted protein [Chaetomium globosum CBS 148.51]|uniref:Uncharacterized protein n=1 Tax=Chaetomium globosum (strain ATCC 6205 / CBS 148.51 / DSM 1962 / NBRC 6347 / NRRL 1970) TaxID=306901 RepID=Q2H3Z0_CHAGB|nr:uncharacterized protein CHGG_06625 [Chaetomium globosum CBS 148.51]EAQ90006.1 predicted protein [Chaetomium globosum CBS 148.51]
MLQPFSKTAVAVTTRAATRRAPTAKPATASRPFSSSSQSQSRSPPPTSSTRPTRTTTRTTATTEAQAQAQAKAEATQKIRRIILTVSFAAVIFTGTIYGAGLKTQQEWKAEKKKVQEASVDEKVAMLERQKLDMLRQKTEIESKVANPAKGGRGGGQ